MPRRGRHVALAPVSASFRARSALRAHTRSADDLQVVHGPVLREGVCRVSLTNKREILGSRGRSTVFCRLCGDMIYARNVVHFGEGVIEGEDGSRRAEKETDLCPPCALYVANDKNKANMEKLELMVRSIAKAEAAGLPQRELEAIAEGWAKRMERDSLEAFRRRIEQDITMMAKFEGRA